MSAATHERIIPTTPTEERLLEGLQASIGHFRDATDIYPKRVTHHIYRILHAWRRAGLVESRAHWISYHEQRESWRLAEGNPALLHDALVTQAATLAHERVVTMTTIDSVVSALDAARDDMRVAIEAPLDDRDVIETTQKTVRDWNAKMWELGNLHGRLQALDRREARLRQRATEAGLDADAVLIGRPWGDAAGDEDPLGGDA